jgi:hypothetical protein
MAILAIERITGDRLGYNPYDSPAQRQAALGRWIEAVESGRFDHAGASPATARAQPTSDRASP